MSANQTSAKQAELRAEMKALKIGERRVSLPGMILGLWAIVSTASAVTTLACL